MSADVIKDFVVALGWKVDQGGQKKVEEAIGSITKSAFALGVALEAAALAAGAAVAKIAAGFETLYYTSQRTGTSVQNIRALSYAFGQVGGSGGQAVASIEAFARNMRTNPGIGAFVRSLGVATDAGGKARDSIDVLADSIEAIQKKHPYYAGAQMAALLGIDETTFNTLVKYRKEINQYRAEYDRISKMVGLNNKEASEASRDFMHSLNTLGTTVGALGQKLLIDLAPAFNKVVRAFLDWIATHPEQVERIVRAISTAIMAIVEAARLLATEAIGSINSFTETIEKWDKDGGIVSTVKAVVDAFKAFFAITKQVDDVLDQMDRVIDSVLGKVLNFLKSGGSGGTAGILGLGAIGGSGGLVADPASYGGGGGSGGGLLDRAKRFYRRHAPEALGGDPGGGGGDAPRGNGAGTKGAAPMSKMMGYAMDQLRREGVPEGNLRQAAAHLVGQAYMESGLDPNKVHDGGTGYGIYGARDPKGWGTYKGARRSDMVRWLEKNGYAKNSAEGQMREMAHRAMSGAYPDTKRILMGGVGSDATNRITKEFEGPAVVNYRAGAVNNAYRAGPAKADSPAQAAPMGKLPSFAFPGLPTPPMGAPMGSQTNNTSSNTAVTMEHKTEIRIDGAGDPATAASRVAGAQDNVHATALRNAQTAIR